jgi:hypothetical protein
MLPDLFDVSSWGILSLLVSLTPNLVVPRGNAERLLSRMPQPIVRKFRGLEYLYGERPAFLRTNDLADRIRKKLI